MTTPTAEKRKRDLLAEMDEEIQARAMRIQHQDLETKDQKPLFISGVELLEQKVTVNPLIGRLIEKGSFVELFGPSAGGKTFIAIDVGSSVATGAMWNGQQCEQGLVLYFAGEGHAGIKKRIKAWHKTHDCPPGMGNLIVSRSAISFDAPNIRRVIGEIRAIEELTGKKVVLIIIDTLARHIQGDESATKDMVDFVKIVQKIMEAFPGSTSILVHHPGHNSENSGRSRGSSSLFAALDYDIMCAKGLLTFKKVKDGEIPAPIEFKLVPVVVGIDDDGNDITSCRVVYGERSAKNREVTLTATEKDLLELIKATPGILSADLRTVYFEHRKQRDPETKYPTAKKAFLRALDGLISKSQIFLDGFSVMPGQGQKRDIAGTCPEGVSGTTGTLSYKSVPVSHPLPGPDIDDVDLPLEVQK